MRESRRVANLSHFRVTAALALGIAISPFVACVEFECSETDFGCSPAIFLPYYFYDAVGELDLDFGGVGYVVHHNAAGGNGADRGRALAVDGARNVIIAGESFGGSGMSTVWRYTNHGNLDTTWNAVGFRVRAAAAGANALYGVRLDSSGAVIALGSADAATTELSALRFRPDGSDDASFGSSGLALFDDLGGAGGGNTDETRGMSMRDDGLILAAGQSGGPSTTGDVYLARISPTGALLGVSSHHNAAGGNSTDDGSAVAIDSNGRYVVAGASFGSTFDMAVWRFLPDGSLDTSFNGVGYFTHDNAAGGIATDYAYAVAIDSSGRIVVVGESERGGPYPTLTIWRLTPAGQLDTSFGGGGYVSRFGDAGEVTTDSSRGRGVAIDTRGRIVVCGSAINSSFDGDMMVWRFHDNGSLDTSFAGGDGFFQHHGAAGSEFSDDICNAMQIANDGRIVLAGSSDNSSDADMAVWRLR